MSEHLFALGSAKPSRERARAIDKIAREEGFNFLEVEALWATNGYQHWFAGPNRGNPHDQNAQARITEALRRAGHLDADGEIIGSRRHG